MSLITSFDIGDQPRLGNHAASGASAFTDAAGTATDPGTSVTLQVDKPTGASTTYTYSGSPALFKEATGRFYVNVTLDVAGLWSYRLLGVGTSVQTAAEGQLHVRQRVTA